MCLSCTRKRVCVRLLYQTVTLLQAQSYRNQHTNSAIVMKRGSESIHVLWLSAAHEKFCNRGEDDVAGSVFTGSNLSGAKSAQSVLLA